MSSTQQIMLPKTLKEIALSKLKRAEDSASLEKALGYPALQNLIKSKSSAVKSCLPVMKTKQRQKTRAI